MLYITQFFIKIRIFELNNNNNNINKIIYFLYLLLLFVKLIIF